MRGDEPTPALTYTAHGTFLLVTVTPWRDDRSRLDGRVVPNRGGRFTARRADG